jgi:hypothetical protein
VLQKIDQIKIADKISDCRQDHFGKIRKETGHVIEGSVLSPLSDRSIVFSDQPV